MNLVGELIALHEHAEAEVAISGKRLRVPLHELVAVARGPETRNQVGARPAKQASRPSGDAGTANGGAEINLVGMTVDEALPRVDKLLDEATMADRQSVRVIHGFGQGRLRKAVAELLEGHPHVAAWRAGNAGEGGGGVTVVELKE